jgi:hypothetical protein
MPVGHPPVRAHPGKPFRTLADAAKQGQLVVLRCNHCRRTTYFLASDLVVFVGPDHPAHVPPMACSRCRKTDYVNVDLLSPRPGDYGRLDVRRLVDVVTVHKWKTVKLGE